MTDPARLPTVAELEARRPTAKQLETRPALAWDFEQELAAAKTREAHIQAQRDLARLNKIDADQERAKDLASLFECVDLETIMADLPPVPWLCEELALAPGAVTIFAGYGFSKKTMAAQSLALSVLSGLPAFGKYPIARSGGVLHIDYEQGQRLTAERYQRMIRASGLDVASLKPLKLASFPKGHLTTPGAFEALEPLAADKALVIIDSFRAAVPGIDENDSGVREYLDKLSAISESTGATVIAIHHARKNDTSGGSQLLRGSGAIFDAAQTVYTFHGERDQPSEVRCQKNRISGRMPADFALSVADEPVECKGLKVTASAVGGTDLRGADEQRVLAYLDNAGGTFQGSRTALSRVIGGKTERTMAAIARLIDGGVVLQDGKTISVL